MMTMSRSVLFPPCIIASRLESAILSPQPPPPCHNPTPTHPPTAQLNSSSTPPHQYVLLLAL
eukprot:scaffold284265_cov30-Tisochrysis_lutea.AAC.1